MANMSVSMILDMVDRFSGKTGRVNQSFTRMSQTGQRAMKSLRRSSDLAYQGLDKLGNRYTAFITGAGGVAAARNVLKLEDRLKRLGIQANRSSEEIEALRKQVIKTAQMPDIRVDPTQILNAFDKIIEKTGDFELAQSNLRNIGLAIQATGAAGEDIGALVADMAEKFDIDKPENLFETLDLLTNQGKAGAFTLQNFATQGERVTAAYAITGRVTKEATREMGAMLQMIRKGVGAPEQAATSFEALMRTLNDAQKRKLLTKAGIQLTDPEDPKRLRSIVEIVKDVVRATGGDAVKLSTVFDGEAMRALNIVAAEYSKTGGFESLDGFMKVTGDGAALLADSMEMANASSSKLKTIVTAVQNGIYNKMTAPIAGVANVVGNTDPSTMDNIVGYGLGGAALLGGLALGVKGHKMIKGMRGKGAVAKAAGGLAGMAGGVQPVMVVNWPSSLGLASGQLSHGFGKKAGKLSRAAKVAGGAGKVGVLAKLARLGRGAGRAVPYLGAGLVALDVGSAVLASDKQGRGEAIGSAGGSLGGAAIGAAVGSIVPGLGTAIGAALGSVFGTFGGGALGRFLTRDKKEELNGKIDISVDAEGRPNVQARFDNKNVNTVIDQGVVMGGAL